MTRLWIRGVALAVGLTLAAGPGHAVPIPSAPKPAKPSGGPRPKGPAAPPPVVAPPPVISPLLLRRRGAPPARVQESLLEAGQAWNVFVVSPDGGSCNGMLRLRQAADDGGFKAGLDLTCSDAGGAYAFGQEVTLIETGGTVVMSFGRATGDARRPHWQALSLIGEGPDRMSGALVDADRTSALTLVRSPS